ncbi:MAG: 16S rRNA (uracil(1498)-N(3))-methyltransferase [Leptolyngbya sp. PLA3]|nr:MAG: 16S rRNA (uracil(1498)-N(3))-methyltransferase [Cyanobacteria bacterium CYA]MCE7967369.1 16S rRNA (uracil(1498)-N(3))-methyltransferase [Leptolyngbya sp. PL-A3]
MHCIYTPDADFNGEPRITVSGEEAHHAARVKRLAPGQRVGLIDGRGGRAVGVVLRAQTRGKSPWLEVEIAEVQRVEPVRPRVCVRSPAPKGEALEWMIDQLSQVGAGAWGLLRTEHAEREPRRLDRLARTVIESAKQCGRAHLMQLLAPVSLDEAVSAGGPVCVADAGGKSVDQAPHAEDITLLVGPEGGWSRRERAVFAERGIPIVGLGPHVFRIETAAVVGASGMLLTGTLRREK